MTIETVPVEERDRAFDKYSHLTGPIASKFIRVYKLPRREIEDLKQIGYVGLLSAANRQGDKLSAAYAGECIKNEIWRASKKLLASQGRRKVKDPITGKLVWPDPYPEEIAGDLEESDCNVGGDYGDEFDDRADPTSAGPTNHENTSLVESLIVKEGFEGLEPEEVGVVRLRHEIGLDVRETAKEMGLHRSKVSRIEQRVREKLKYLRSG